MCFNLFYSKLYSESSILCTKTLKTQNSTSSIQSRTRLLVMQYCTQPFICALTSATSLLKQRSCCQLSFARTCLDQPSAIIFLLSNSVNFAYFAYFAHFLFGHFCLSDYHHFSQEILFSVMSSCTNTFLIEYTSTRCPSLNQHQQTEV